MEKDHISTSRSKFILSKPLKCRIHHLDNHDIVKMTLSWVNEFYESEECNSCLKLCIFWDATEKHSLRKINLPSMRSEVVTKMMKINSFFFNKVWQSHKNQAKCQWLRKNI